MSVAQRVCSKQVYYRLSFSIVCSSDEQQKSVVNNVTTDCLSVLFEVLTNNHKRSRVVKNVWRSTQILIWRNEEELWKTEIIFQEFFRTQHLLNFWTIQKGSINVVCQNRTGFNMKVDMVTVQERVMDWSREDNEAQSGDFCESRNFKKDRKTKEWIDGGSSSSVKEFTLMWRSWDCVSPPSSDTLSSDLSSDTMPMLFQTQKHDLFTNREKTQISIKFSLSVNLEHSEKTQSTNLTLVHWVFTHKCNIGYWIF